MDEKEADGDLQLHATHAVHEPVPDKLTQHQRSCKDIPFRTVVKFFEKCLSMRTPQGKADVIRIFRETHVPRESDDIFQLYRLLCPDKDSHRASFFMQVVSSFVVVVLVYHSPDNLSIV